MGSVIDVHFHYPLLNPLLHTAQDVQMSRLRKRIFVDGTMRYYCKMLNVKYTTDFEELNKAIHARVVDIINGSAADHVVTLAFDGVYDAQGKELFDKSLLHIPNEQVYALAQAHKKVLAGPSINPTRKDALEELHKAADNNAALVKLHPCVQLYDARLPEFRPFYKLAAELGLPLLVHVGFEIAVPGMEIRHEFTGLDQVIPMLDEGCTVIAAHGGGGTLRGEKKWFSNVLDMLEQYPELYLDNSALMRVHRKVRVFSLLESELALERLAFGTDFPVTPTPEVFARKLGVKKARELRHMENPLDMDIELKRALGFPEETFSRGYDIISSKAL